MNLVDAQLYLEELGKRAATERDDAAAAAQLADEDAARFERFAASLAALHFGPDVVAAVGQLRQRAQARKDAAAARAVHAEAIQGDVARLQALLAPHFTIREQGQTAGGLADREAYDS